MQNGAKDKNGDFILKSVLKAADIRAVNKN